MSALEGAGARLDVELVRRGLARSRSRGAALIADGRVEVDGLVVRKPSLDVTGRRIALRENGTAEYVSRGGHKLAGALDRLADLQVAGRRCLDAGASTGGFTDALLQAGAREVVAVDVGRDQLAHSLRGDRRVRVVDGQNARSLNPAGIGGVADLSVCDLSFISIRLVLPALIACTVPDGDLLPMVKSQFEVGRGKLGRGGVVGSVQVRADVVQGVSQFAEGLGWSTRAVVASPLPGPAGNLEYFLWLRRDPRGWTGAQIRRAVEG